MEMMAPIARKHRMVMIIPVHEKEQEGVYFNAAVVLDADGAYLGKMRKVHIPHTYPAFWEKFSFKPGTLGFLVFSTAYARIGIYICYDRHFPECARILALKGAEILFNPSATTEGKSRYLWELEQPSQAVANGVFIGANNRVGVEKPWEFGKFYGSSYFVDPRGKTPVKGSEDRDEVVVADLDLEQIRGVGGRGRPRPGKAERPTIAARAHSPNGYSRTRRSQSSGHSGPRSAGAGGRISGLRVPCPGSSARRGPPS